MAGTKKVLITGAGGSIGAHFISYILENTNWHITTVDSFRHKGEFDRISEVANGKEYRITSITHDLTAPITNREVERIGNVDYIINLASLSDVQDSIDNPVPFIRNNVDITLNMLEYARQSKPKAFVQFSTDEVYGPASVDQAHEEWSPILPSNPYAASKACQEAIAISYWRSYGVPVVITNTMNNYGEMQQPNKYPVKIQKAIENGETIQVHTSADGQIGTRYYLHSTNAADAVLFILANHPPHKHEPGVCDKPDRYNVVGDIQLDNLQLAKEIAKLMGKELKYNLVDFHSDQPGHDLHYGLDGAKLKELGWEPPFTFKDSMKKTIEWQQQHREWING